MTKTTAFRRPLLALAASLATVAVAFAQGTNEAPKVELKLDKASAAVGSKLKGTLIVTFAPGLHSYQNPPSEQFLIPVVVKAGDKEFKLGKVTYPKGVDAKIGGSPTAVKTYEGTIRIPVEITMPAKTGVREVTLTFSYQQCNESSCFAPAEVSASAKVKIVAKPKHKGKG